MPDSLLEMHRRLAGKPSLFPSWKLVQSVINNGTSFTSTLPGNVTKGNLIIAFIGYQNSGPPVMSDTLGNTWTLADTSVVNAGPPQNNNFLASIAFCVANASGAMTATAAGVSAIGGTGFGLFEFSGNTLTPFDKTVHVNQENTATLSASITTAKTNELIVTLFTALSNNPVPSPPLISIFVGFAGYLVGRLKQTYTVGATQSPASFAAQIVTAFFGKASR